MVRKRTKTGVGKTGPLTKVQQSYIETQMYKISAEAIAADLKVSLARVERAVATLRKRDAAKTATPKLEGAGNATQQPQRQPPKRTMLEKLTTFPDGTRLPGGAVVMTEEASIAADAAMGASPFANLIGITEAQMAYVRTHMGTMPIDKLAKDVGLLPVQVQQLIDNFNPAITGRDKFYQRNRSTIHKIDPTKPIS